MEFNKINKNSNSGDLKLSQNKSLNKFDNKFQHEIDYQNLNHPLEALGRSMVNFKGKKPEFPEYSKEEFLELVKKDGRISEYYFDIFDNVDDKNASCVAYIYNKAKEEENLYDFEKFIKPMSKIVVAENAEFFASLLNAKWVYCSTKEDFFSKSFRLDKNEENKEEVIKKTIEKGKIFDRIVKLEIDGKDCETTKRYLAESLDDLNFDNFPVIQEVLKEKKDVSWWRLGSIMPFVTSENKEFARKYLLNTDEMNYNEDVFDAKNVTPDKKKKIFAARLNILNRFLANENKNIQDYSYFSSVNDILKYTDYSNEKVINELLNIKEITLDDISDIVRIRHYENSIQEQIDSKKLEIIEEFKQNSNIFPELLVNVLKKVNLENCDLAIALLKENDKDSICSIEDILRCGYISTMPKVQKEIFDKRLELLQKMKEETGFINSELLKNYDVWNADLADEIIEDKKVPFNKVSSMINIYSSDLRYPEEREEILKTRQELYKKLKNNPEIDGEDLADIISTAKKENLSLIEKLINDKDIPNSSVYAVAASYLPEETEELYDKYKDSKEFDKNSLVDLLKIYNGANRDYIKKLIKDKDFPNDKIAKSLNCYNFIGYYDESLAKERMAFYEKMEQNENVDKTCLIESLQYLFPDNYDKVENLVLNAKKLELTPQALAAILDEKIDYRDYKKALNIYGREKIAKLDNEELKIYVNFIDAYKKDNINEIPIYAKRNFLRKLISANENLFNLTEETKNNFPLLPQNQEQYCTLLPQIVKSLGFEVNELNKDEIWEFNSSLFNFADSISKIPDEEFNKIEIKQEYPKDDFIKDVLREVKNLSKSERQKVYDYFGFELYKNNKTKTGFAISGYPINLNNGKKLAQINNENTKKVVESLRPFVVKFSKNNKIISNNKNLEPLLNKIVKALPELRVQIDKPQAGMENTKGAHEFDVFKHSLKVMQKIAQNPEFENLNDSDKKIILLSSLLHDITKREACFDVTHNDEGSFDSFFIAKKFNLDKEEQIKLYTLIKHHSWLQNVNRAKDSEELKEKLKSCAYDLRLDNLFDMSLIFTQADLKAVKKDDSFYDSKEEKMKIYTGRDSDTIENNTIKGYINELRKSQPLLPVTKFPKADEIEKAIKKVYPDGSTDIKGVYKDENGLVVIKYNEVEDFEKIGFKKGTTSKGIITTTPTGEKVNTGNIKFFAHGLDFSNQLAKFDAFSLPDSDALLSVSYAERPESKYRFFRPQGVILDVDTKYIHGGGDTDAGSGCSKNIEIFKQDYLFGAAREKDRLFVSELIKLALNLDDEEYIEFVNENKNKSLSEIQPKETRQILIEAFASINSNKRNGDREYNEMYVTNPKPPMAVFAYALDEREKINNPVEFLNRTTLSDFEQKIQTNWGAKPKSISERTEFLKKYALEHNIPFVVFGD